jgi:lambda family phage tail tape measure protein
MSDVIGKGVIEVSADSRKLTAGIDEAKRSLKSLGIAAGDATKGQRASIDKYIKSLGQMAVTSGKTGRELELYKLALRGASAEQLKAADSALRMAEGYAKGERIGAAIKTGLLTLGAVAATGLIAAYVAFDKLNKKAGDFQDMAEKVGDTAQNIASLAVAAGTAGTGMETVVSASAKLTKGLTGVDDESKAAGSAIAALGLSIKDFKALAPADQMEAVAKALAGFKDGAEKTAVAMALFGKSGADLLPFLKELGAEGGRQVILTQTQIEQADAYSDKQAKLRTELGLHAQAISTQMIPAYNAFTEALIETAKEALGMRNGIKGIADDNSIKEFAQDGALLLANLADVAYDVAGAFRFVGNNLGAMAAIAAANLRLDFAGARAIGQASDEQNEKILKGLGLADKVQARIDAMNSRNTIGAYTSRSTRDAKDAKPTLNFNGAQSKGGKGGAGGGEARSQLVADLSGIKAASDALTNTYGNAQKIMEAMRSAGLVDERDYYASKLAFLNLNNQAQEDALKQEIDRRGKEKLSGKDKLDNLRKITEAQAKLDKLRENSATSLQLLSIQEEAATKKLAQYYRDAEAAAQDYLDTISKAQQRDLSGMGVGNQERDRTSGRAQIEDKYSNQRKDLEKSRRDAELNGTFGTDAQKKYDDELDRIRRFQAKALSEYDTYFSERMKKESDWSIGASEAMANYMSESHNIAKQSEKVWTDAFQGMEDALVSFVQTVKLDFQSLANSIVADITRIIIKQQISNALGMATGGGSGSSGGGFLTSIIGAAAGYFGGTGAQASVASSMGGDSLDNMLKLTKNFSGRAIGGPVSAGGLYRVNESRPELLQVAGKQYLMMGNQGGTVDANKDSGNGSSGQSMVLNQTVNFVNSGPVDRRTQAQVGAAAYSAGARLTARNS